MNNFVFVLLALSVWPLSAALREKVPSRGRRFILLVVTLACAVRLAQLIYGGAPWLPITLHAVAVGVLAFGALRMFRRTGVA